MQEARHTVDHDQRWEDSRRIEGWAGEVRINLIRLTAILVFYGQHLLNVYVFRDDKSITGAIIGPLTVCSWFWPLLSFCWREGFCPNLPRPKRCRLGKRLPSARRHLPAGHLGQSCRS